ncbi:MAG: low specificity L-threonine aldolase [Hyphomicrobiaceae bacterium]|nr:low specificity L-threonine aldolase [Hyphomicrobiaceae bacterium]
MPDKNRFIELISDTATRPTEGMRLAMAAAEVGDEQRGEDPSVNRLCVRVANLLGHEAGVYLPSGIMSNLIAMLVHCRPGDEIIGSAGNAHIIGSEGAGAAAIAGALISTIDTPDGRFSAADVANRLRPHRARTPRTSLVLVEQTSNKGGGTVWPAAQIADIAETAHSGGAALHMDGARLLNAAIASGCAPSAFSAHCDSAWLDLSKGLGCPVGSVLVGSKAFIEEAWVWKHRLGGAMRQAGIIAAAGLYALDHHVERLAEDHANARRLADGIRDLPGVKLVPDVIETNIIFVDVADGGRTATDVAADLLAAGVRVGAQSPSVLRAVTHLDVDAADIETAIRAFRAVFATDGPRK